MSTLNGTTHVFPMSPYGGEPTVRTHTSSRVVNKMSRFHTSAGMDSITSNHYHSHNSVPNSKNAVPRSSQSHVQLSPSSPPQSIANHRETPSIPYYMNGYNRWSNPRSLPLPTPVIVTALQQIKQPYQSPCECLPMCMYVCVQWNVYVCVCNFRLVKYFAPLVLGLPLPIWAGKKERVGDLGKTITVSKFMH